MKFNNFILFLLLFLIRSDLQSQNVYTLDDCIQIALKNNKNVSIARFQVETADAEKRGTLSTILPTVNYSAGYLNQGSYISPQIADIIPRSEFYSAGISINQNIYDGGKWWNQIALANNIYHSSRGSEQEARVTVVLNVKRAFYQYLKDLQLLEVTKQSVELAKQQVELVKHQYEVEAVARTDLLKQQVQLGNSEVDYLNQQAATRNSFNQLANAMGLRIDANFSVIDTIEPTTPIDSFFVLWERVKNNNPSLITQQTQIQGSELRLKIAQANFFPRLSISMSYDGSGDVFDKLYSNFRENWRLQTRLSISYPLFTGFSQSTQVEMAKVNNKIEQEKYVNLIQDLEVQLDFILRKLNNLRKVIPIYEATKQSADEDLRLAQERYNLGAATILDVLDAQLSVTRANSSLVQAIYDEKILRAELDAIAGKY